MKRILSYATVIFFAVLSTSCTRENVGNGYKVNYENAIDIEVQLLELINNHRTHLGYNTLKFSDVAYIYSNDHTNYMISQGEINHHNFESRASQIVSKANASSVSENVGKDYDTAEEAFDAWINSPSHKSTIEGEFTHTAISVKIDSDNNYYFTNMFYEN
ncbi:MAG: CAP domain-containing protein [Cellulophaga sp.]